MPKMLKSLVCIAFLFLAAASAGSVKFQDCGHKEVTNVTVEGCEGDICRVHKGMDFKLEAEFVANQNSKHASVEMIAIVDEDEFIMPGVNYDGCTYFKCPLVKGQKYNFAYSRKVSPAQTMSFNSTVNKVKITGSEGLLACLTYKISLQVFKI